MEGHTAREALNELWGCTEAAMLVSLEQTLILRNWEFSLKEPVGCMQDCSSSPILTLQGWHEVTTQKRDG